MAETIKPMRVLVMGVGNTLLQDDGIGVHVAESLRADHRSDPAYFDTQLDIIDGGTIGLSLLPDIEDAEAVIIVDASEMGDRPGALRVFRDREIDLLPSRIVGRRREGVSTPDTADTLLRTAWALRGGIGLAPRGLYRFETFEEAQQWMTSQMSRRSALRRSKTSAAPTARSRPARRCAPSPASTRYRLLTSSAASCVTSWPSSSSN